MCVQRIGIGQAQQSCGALELEVSYTAQGLGRIKHMTSYVAFLRAINVAGQKLIKMKELAQIFAAAGCKNVRTYIQSGNVIFDYKSTNSAALSKKIERTLQQVLGYEVTVMLRTLSEVEALVRRNPFKKIKT